MEHPMQQLSAIQEHVSDPTVIEQEYREQLAHADQLIDGLMQRCECLLEENARLRKWLGVPSATAS